MQKSILLSAALTTMLFAQIDTHNHSQEAIESTPNLSLTIDSSIVDRNMNNTGYSELSVAGFTHANHDDEHGHDHAVLNEKEGFNLNYAELSVQGQATASTDVKAIFHLTEGSFEIEELYAKSKLFSDEILVKLGKFKSAFGHHNQIHHHAYDFAESPLIYDLLFGYHGLNEKGVQVQYTLPTSWYMLAGVELLRGENELSFGDTGFIDIDDASQPNLLVGYLKSKFNIHKEGYLSLGLSVASGESRIDHLEDEETPHAFYADTNIYGVDMLYTVDIDLEKDIAFGAEYLYRDMDGKQYVPNDTGDAWQNSVGLHKKQSGYYAKVLYRHNDTLRFGVRYSGIVKNEVVANNISMDKPESFGTTSVMAEYQPSHQSRIRVQYSHSDAYVDEDGEPQDLDEVILQFTYILGNHAH